MHTRFGRELFDSGRFDEALPWFERAVEAGQKGDLHGCVDHDSLGASVHAVGHCHSSAGRYDEALPWFERAVEAKQKGDVRGRVDHQSLVSSLDAVSSCRAHLGLPN